MLSINGVFACVCVLILFSLLLFCIVLHSTVTANTCTIDIIIIRLYYIYTIPSRPPVCQFD